jgi:hypothetical protein
MNSNFINKEYIYLDWNIFQNMKHSYHDNNTEAKELEKLISKLSKKYFFPYSGVHLEDLVVSTEKNSNFILEDLSYLKNISNGFLIGRIKELNNELRIEKFSVLKAYKQIKENYEFEKSIKINFNTPQFDPIEIELSQMNKDNLFYNLLKNNKGIFDSKIFNDFIENLIENINNSGFINKFRKNVMELKQAFKNTHNSILDQNSIYFENIEDFLTCTQITNKESFQKDFNKYLKSFFLATEYHNGENMPLDYRIYKSFCLLDYSSLFKEKFKKKNKPSNARRDSSHLYFASKAKYFITEDKNLYEKVKFISEVFNLKLKVLKTTEFLNKFNSINL